jgi:ligand-binding sensor domain-containing protein
VYNGFPDVSPFTYAQDSSFQLWIGSDKGLLKFDGQTFEVYTMIDGLPANQVTDIAVHPIDKTVWVVTSKGICILNEQLFEPIEIDSPFENQTYRTIEIGVKGNIYLGGQAGMTIIRDGHATHFSKESGFISNFVKTIKETTAGHLFAGAQKGLYLINERDSISSVQGTSGMNVRKIKESPEGELYILEGMGDILKLNNEHWKTVISESFISDFYIDKKGKLYVFLLKEIITISADGTVKRIRNMPGDADEVQTYGFLDHEENIWVYKSEALIHSIKNDLAFVQPCQDAAFDFCQVDFEGFYQTHDQAIWLSTELGIGKFNGEVIEEPVLKFDGTRGGMTGIEIDDHGHYWISFLLGGLTKWDGSSREDYFNTGYLTERYVFDLVRLSDGSILAARNGEIIKIKNDSFSHITPRQLEKKDISNLVEAPDKIIWASSFHGGLFAMQGDSIISTYFEHIPIPKIKLYKNELWILSNGLGLIHARILHGGQLGKIEYHNKKNGLNEPIILDFIPDSTGRIWLITPDELIYLDHYAKPPFHSSFTLEDGYMPYTYEKSALFIDLKNQLWIANNTGAQKLNLNTFQLDETPVQLTLQEVQMNGSPTKKNLFKPKENTISFQYNGIYFKNPKRVKYRTRMNGLAEEWSDWSTKNSTTFRALPSGRYTFQVEASNGNGLSTMPIEYAFKIKTPLFKSRLFQFLIFVLGLFIAARLYRARITRLNERAENQNRINQQLSRLEIEALRSKMNPHFIFNSLNSIQHLILEKNEKGALDYLNRFSKLIRQVLERSADSKIKLKDEVEMLKHYIELESLRFDHPFQYQIEIEDQLETQNPEIPYLLLQPFVENAIHHGLIPKKGKGLLIIRANGHNGHIQFTIEDNGIGRKAAGENRGLMSNKKQSKGIEVTTSRLRLLHKNLQNQFIKMIDLYDTLQQPAGTRVEISIPIM